MPIDLARSRKLLDACDLDTLFVELLGWDHHRANLSVATKDGEFALRGFAQKRGFAAFLCEAGKNGKIPDHATRAMIDREVTKSAREHVIVYANKQKSEQVWQWARRAKDQPIKRREFAWRSGQNSGHLIERVFPSIAFSLAEEEKLTLPDVTSKASAAFDVEKVTKKFFERFQAEHKAFHKFIDGIEGVADKDWYASVMLNRLMFCYFIQKKGLLNGEHDYLKLRLAKLQSTKGKDKFWSFYRHFLLKLFHEGLSTKSSQRAKELDALIGKIPYLNGGLFDVHELEAKHKDIEIPDKAFERIFQFFDEYRWHLDERPLAAANEINPDVLGYIFEKYINQKQMGAYYTKEDITEYISKNTIIPFILDQATKNCAIAFKASESGSVWRLLKNDPDRYIYDAVLHGVVDDSGKAVTLPPDIEAGVNNVAKRGGWNKPAAAPFALPTETWREHVARRQRCLELRQKLAKGEVQTVNDLVTLNLDIRQFAEDVIANAEGPDLLRAVWKAVESVTVLDPTCGSGAFLFAALTILEPLYEACLDRMESFLEDLKRAEDAGEKVHPDKFKDFKAVLAQVALHPNSRYFILKSIIVSNLYGVDIMEEACEICKLRLFLKLVAQVEEGVGGIEKIEPLPDIDFNIRAGNTLVGFTSIEAIEKAAPTFLASVGFVDAIKVCAEQAATAFRLFREMQTKQGVGSTELAEGKRLVREKLKSLHEELDRYLASECEVDTDRPKALDSWRKSHQPFHWFVDFYAIMASGGFDVIVGNPPYVEYAKVKKQYVVRGFSTFGAGNLYAFVIERSALLINPSGRMGLIVPIALLAVGEVAPVRKLLLDSFQNLHFSSYAIRPAKLFTGVEQRLVIVLGGGSQGGQTFSTKYNQWFSEQRPALFQTLEYGDISDIVTVENIPKPYGQMGVPVLAKIKRGQGGIAAGLLVESSKFPMFFHRTPGYWVRFMDFEPFFRSPTANRSVHHIREIYAQSADARGFLGALMSSSLFFLWFFGTGNCRNLTLDDVRLFPCGSVPSQLQSKATVLFGRLMANYKEHSLEKTRGDTRFQEFQWALAKPVVDDIDRLLAAHFGLTEDELELVIHHDEKIRCGDDDVDLEEVE